MIDLVHRRLQNERALMTSALEQLGDFVQLRDELGAPPVAYRLALQPFGFLVRARDATEPTTFSPAEHGRATLLLSVDPRLYPLQSWRVWLQLDGTLEPFSPHIGAEGAARGAVCWTDARSDHGVHDWPAPKVLTQTLRILAGEAVALEGFALHEEAKVWFAANRARLPMARVPEPRLGAAFAQPTHGGLRHQGASALGIEFGPESASGCGGRS